MNYNEKNRHERDRRIAFDAGSHTYLISPADGSEPFACESVTTIVEDCFEKFDADYWAARKATPEKPAEMLKAEWAAKGKEARDLGTLLHDRIERFYLGELIEDDAYSDRAFGYFLDFARTYRLTPYRSEWRIFSERYRIAGTLDFLAQDGSDFIIYDWKRSSKLVDGFGRPITDNRWHKCGYGAACRIPDTTYHHYALQVSIYRYLLECEYGIRVRSGHLGTFHPDHSRYYMIDMPYLRDEVAELLRQRESSIPDHADTAP